MKTKPILLFVVTLLIGFIIGMLTSAQIRYNKLKPVRVYFSEQRFRDGFYRAIQPDEEQKVKIDQILDKYAVINSNFQKEFRKNLDSTMKEFRKELDSNLTKEQLGRLKEMDDRRQEMIKENRKTNQHEDSLRRRDNRDGDRYRRSTRDGFQSHDGPHPMLKQDTTRVTR